MFHLADGHSFYRQTGLWLLVLQFSLFAFGLPPFETGIWLQTEPVIVALFAFACCNSLWLALGIAKGWLARRPNHPIMLCMLLWVGWQWLATLAASSPWRSWFGPPEIGEGAGWYTAQLLLMLLAYPLWQVAAYRRIIIGGALFSLLAQCGLFLFDPPDPAGVFTPGCWAPGQWAAYLAFIAGAVWIIVVAGFRLPGAWAYALLAVFTYGVLLVSGNRSALKMLPLAMMVSIAVILLSRYPAAARFFNPKRAWRRLAMLACVLPMSWVVFSVCFPALHVKAGGDGYLSQLATKNSAIGSRLGLNQVAFATLQHEPLRLLIGDGWGRFTDDMFKYSLLDDVHIYQDGKHQPNWLFVEGSVYHSHNQPLEALLSLGIPGLLLWFALPMLALMLLPRELFWPCAPMLVMLVALSYVWLEVPPCLPFQALAWAVLCTVCPAKTPFAHPGKTSWFVVGFAICALAMAWSVWQQTEAMQYGERIHEATQKDQPYQGFSPAWLDTDIARGGNRLRTSGMGYGMFLSGKTAIDDNERGWYGQFMEAAHDANAAAHTPPRTASLSVWLDYKLLIDLGFPQFAQLGHQAVMALPEELEHLSRLAPLRDDVASFYLVNMDEATHHDIERQKQILNALLAAAPNHRGALWVLGHIWLKTQGREAEGEAMVRRAVALGVERVYPVTEQEMAAYK